MGRRLALLLASILHAATPAGAGTISVAWDPVTDPDLAGYRVFWGTAAGSYSDHQDVGVTTALTLSGLTDCTTYYVAVKARDAAGNLSTGYSNQVVGLPRPVVSAVSPAAAEQGLPLTIVLGGFNFADGATIQFGNPSVTVQSVIVNSCTQITANITVGSGAAVGPVTVDVTNADGTFGTSAGLFAVQAAAPPAVAGVNPPNLTTGVAVDVHPAVLFSEAMKPASISAATIKLLEPNGNAVAQASGSPSLSADGKTATIIPAAALAYGRTYKVQVLGGSTGVRDLANNPMSATYTQASGFTTQADTTSPVLSAVTVSALQATSATLSWTTDEAADSQVFYRRAGDVTYQSTAVDTTLGTTHTMVLQGLAPQTEYAFYVRSADAEGNATTSSPDGTFSTSASAYSYLRIEPETGAIAGPVRASQGTAGFRGAWIDTPAGTSTGSATNPAGKSEMSFYVPADGTWTVWVRLWGGTATSDTWYESMDGGGRALLSPAALNTWKWTATRSFTLSRGLHVFELGGREAQARADRVIVTNDPAFLPTEAPTDDVTPPAAPANLAAAASDRAVTLTWTNPAADVASVVVRVRTDGRFPQSPVDGQPVESRAASDGGAESVTHAGLTNGTSYAYAVFVVDAAGNASAAGQVSMAPVDNVPPSAPGSAWRTDKR
jgi:chitodextrinase